MAHCVLASPIVNTANPLIEAYVEDVYLDQSKKAKLVKEPVDLSKMIFVQLWVWIRDENGEWVIPAQGDEFGLGAPPPYQMDIEDQTARKGYATVTLPSETFAGYVGPARMRVELVALDGSRNPTDPEFVEVEAF